MPKKIKNVNYIDNKMHHHKRTTIPVVPISYMSISKTRQTSHSMKTIIYYYALNQGFLTRLAQCDKNHGPKS